VIYENIVTLAKGETGGDVAQGQRGGADQGDFLGLAAEELRRKLAGMVQPVEHVSFLVAEGSLAGAFGNGVGHAGGQWADAGMGEEDFFAGDGEFAPAKFLLGEQVG
jgi:hypothetical protein